MGKNTGNAAIHRPVQGRLLKGGIMATTVLGIGEYSSVIKEKKERTARQIKQATARVDKKKAIGKKKREQGY
jgi:hypothetical protein